MKKKINIFHHSKEFYVELMLVFILFIILSYFVQTNTDIVRTYIRDDYIGIILYIIITIIAVVIAPISATPLLPIASNLWGWFAAALLSIFGWTMGALIAFFLARRYGLPLVKKIVPLKRLKKVEDQIPQDNLFWLVVLMRMAVPVDLLSYALGLFTKMKYKDYILATIIGISPFAFVLAYLGEVPVLYQVMAFIVAFSLLIVGYIISSKGREENEKRKGF